MKYAVSGCFKLLFVSSHLRETVLRRCTPLLKQQQQQQQQWLIWSVLLASSILSKQTPWKGLPACTAYLTSGRADLSFTHAVLSWSQWAFSRLTFGKAETCHAHLLSHYHSDCVNVVKAVLEWTNTKNRAKTSLLRPPFSLQRRRVIVKPYATLRRQKTRGFKATPCCFFDLKIIVWEVDTSGLDRHEDTPLFYSFLSPSAMSSLVFLPPLPFWTNEDLWAR